MKFVLLINLKLLSIANAFLLNIAKHEIFFAKKYENANYFVCIFIFISSEDFMRGWVEHEKSFITSGPDRHLLYYITVFFIICVSLWYFTDEVDAP